jgi:colanic acid/amylovoran biosynthesis glycosyltransferase
MGCPADKIVRLPVGLDCSIFSPGKELATDLSGNVIRLLYIGRLIEFKGIIIALKAFAKLRREVDNDIYFDIIGEGELWDDVHKLVVELGIEPFVVFHGSLERDKIISIMNNSDIFLFPGITASNGRQENQGLVIQEAQAMGIPVVVSDFGGVPEGMLDGETGYALPEGNMDAIVYKLKHLVDNPELRIHMGTSGRTYVLENFDSSIVGNRLERIYQELTV